MPTKRNWNLKSFFSSRIIPNLRKTPDTFLLKVAFWHSFLSLSLSSAREEQNHNSKSFPWSNKIYLRGGHRGDLQGGRWKDKGGCKFIPGLSGSKDSGRHHFALIWFYTIPFDIISLFGRERAQSQLCPCRIQRKPVFPFKEKCFQCWTSYSE